MLYISRKEEKIQLLLLFLVCAELLFNFYVSIYKHDFVRKKMVSDFGNTMENMVSDTENEDLFYRVDSNATFTQIDSMLYGYYGVDVFLSSLNTNVLNFFNNIGSAVRTNSYVYSVTTPITDSILGVRYRIFKGVESDYYTEISRYPVSAYGGILYNFMKVDAIVYQNPYAVPLGFMVSDDILEFKDRVLSSSEITKLNYQNILFQTLTDTDEDVLKMLAVEKLDSFHYRVPVVDHNTIYMMINDIEYEGVPFAVSVYINDVLYNTYDISLLNVMEISNNYEIGNYVDVRLEFSISGVEDLVQLKAASFDLDVFKENIDSLNTNSFEITSFRENHIVGKVTATEDKSIFFTTIPYENGWNIYVDGEKVPYYEMMETFIGFGLESGEHTIEFKFIPPGLYIGSIVSVISVALFTLYMCFYKKIHKNV